MEGTYSNQKEMPPILSIEELEKIAGLCKYERPSFPEHRPSLLKKIMNRFGWYRKTTVYILSEKHLLNWASNFKQVPYSYRGKTKCKKSIK
ncbi:unnamed protein product [marine sediment metagenome]|uniref:Uncharacterized protein n=1 Tax=marine sediment metagenome TaxID=412755 RepID=X1CHH3_9ZZZZ